MEGATVTTTAALLSGGMDSYALTFEKRPHVAITIDYGQRPAEAEIGAAKLLARRLDIRHEIVHLDMRELGSGDLSANKPADAAPASDWWPFRNQALITIAAMKLIDSGVDELMLATVVSDSSHKDGTKEFIELSDALLSNQEGNMRVTAPAIEMTTLELIHQSRIPLSLLAWSHSCHTSNVACGRCRGCNKSREVFEGLGLADR
tara:strand:- start:14654 stop:15268 length:615 start_codon:yes stop_codon:yes gene_type:complete